MSGSWLQAAACPVRYKRTTARYVWQQQWQKACQPGLPTLCQVPTKNARCQRSMTRHAARARPVWRCGKMVQHTVNFWDHGTAWLRCCELANNGMQTMKCMECRSDPKEAAGEVQQHGEAREGGGGNWCECFAAGVPCGEAAHQGPEQAPRGLIRSRLPDGRPPARLAPVPACRARQRSVRRGPVLEGGGGGELLAVLLPPHAHANTHTAHAAMGHGSRGPGSRRLSGLAYDGFPVPRAGHTPGAQQVGAPTPPLCRPAQAPAQMRTWTAEQGTWAGPHSPSRGRLVHAERPTCPPAARPPRTPAR